MKKILLTLVFLLIAFPAYAYELLMFSNPQCQYCQKFLEEVKPTYHKSEYAKHLPLKVINTNVNPPIWIRKAFEEFRLEPINETPTFVIWDGKEVARLIGYIGKEKFYESIGVYIEENTGEFKSMPDRGPMNQLGDPLLPPPGVINSRNLLSHMYKTPELALKASDWFGCGGNIHYHPEENVWMPCSME